LDQNNVEMIYMEKNIHCCTYTCIHCPGLQAYHQYDVSLRPAWKLQKGCTRLAAASDKVYQLLAQGRWFSLDTPTSSHFQQYFSYIMATSFSDGGSRSIQREPPTLGKQLVNFITCGCESSAPFL
jgi:hypothetical protein